jgi:hypothetical protein
MEFDVGQIYEKLMSNFNYHLDWTIPVTTLHGSVQVFLGISFSLGWGEITDPEAQVRFLALPEKKKRVVGLGRGPLSLVSTTEELFDRKVAAPV